MLGLVAGVVIVILIYLQKQEQIKHLTEANRQQIEEINKRHKAEEALLVEKTKNESQRQAEIAVKKRIATSSASIKGLVGEHMAPLLPEFRYELSDARFLGEPIDYIIFENLTRLKDEIQAKIPKESRTEMSLVFVEIKTGKKSELRPEQRAIKDAIEAKRVKFDKRHLNIPDSEQNAEEVTVESIGQKPWSFPGGFRSRRMVAASHSNQPSKYLLAR